MKRLKLKRIKITFKDKGHQNFEVFKPEEYIETFANTFKNKEYFHVTLHKETLQHEKNYEEHSTFDMDDIENIIQEWR